MRYSIEFDIEIPDGVDEDDVIEWIRFELNDNGSMANSNPLSRDSIEPIFGSLIIEDRP